MIVISENNDPLIIKGNELCDISDENDFSRYDQELIAHYFKYSLLLLECMKFKEYQLCLLNAAIMH